MFQELYEGRFQILQELGEGAMGKVYKALDIQQNVHVALKVILDFDHADEQIVKRFHRESKAIAQLQHPNIVGLNHVGQHQGHPFFTMDFVAGNPLTDLIEEGLEFKKSAKIMAQVAGAIHYAHSNKIIHRDLKPDNIMIDTAGKPQVMDFGVAKVQNAQTILTHAGMVMGTPTYMSPEQARGQVKKIDARSDVFSLGMILYELLVGEPPFLGEPVDVMRQVVKEVPPRPRSANPEIPKKLEAICLKAIKKKKNERYQSAKGFKIDLERYLKGKAITAKITSPFWDKITSLFSKK